MRNFFIAVFLAELLRKSDVLANKIKFSYEEVSLGDNAVLICGSCDTNHTFEYWILDNNVVIGPANENFDNNTFSYDAESGNLTIKSVSKEMEGIYTCVSKDLKGGEIKVKKIKLLVEEDWEEVYEHDSNLNLIRVLIIVATLVLLTIGGYVIYRMWRERYFYPSYLGHEEDGGSTEEIYRSPTTSSFSRSRSPRRIVLERTVSNPLEGDSVSTDFKSILERTNS